MMARMGWSVLALALSLVAVDSAVAQGRGRGAPAAPAGPASLAGRWEGTYTNDITQKTGRIVLTLSGSDESASGQAALTPAGARGPIAAQDGVAPAPARGAPAGLPVTLMKTGDETVTGNIDAAYTDPGCNCVVVTSVEGTLSGSTLTGSLAARDSRTGQWNFSSFTVTKRAGR